MLLLAFPRYLLALTRVVVVFLMFMVVMITKSPLGVAILWDHTKYSCSGSTNDLLPIPRPVGTLPKPYSKPSPPV